MDIKTERFIVTTTLYGLILFIYAQDMGPVPWWVWPVTVVTSFVLIVAMIIAAAQA